VAVSLRGHGRVALCRCREGLPAALRRALRAERQRRVFRAERQTGGAATRGLLRPRLDKCVSDHLQLAHGTTGSSRQR